MNTDIQASKPAAFIALNDKSSFVKQYGSRATEVDIGSIVRHLSKGVKASNIKSVGAFMGWAEGVLLEVLDIPVSTYHRKVKAKSKLPRDESERLYRVVEVYNAALELFDGNRSLVNNWLNKPMTALEGETPMEMLKSELGSREVLNLIITLEYGMYT